MRTPLGGGETSVVSDPGEPDRPGPAAALRLRAAAADRRAGDAVHQRLEGGRQPVAIPSCASRSIGSARRTLACAIADLGRALRLMVSGEDEISSYREAGERYPVKIRVREDQRSDMNAIGGLMVPSATRHAGARGQSSRTLERGFGPDDHPALQPAVLDVDLRRHQARPAARRRAARGRVARQGPRTCRPATPTKFTGQSKLLDETTNNMVLALSLASIFIYIVLAMQFESFVQPLRDHDGAAAVGPLRAAHALDDRAAC